MSELSHLLYDMDGMFIDDWSNITNYSHEHTALGPYQASFKLSVEDGKTTVDDLVSWFNNRLMLNMHTVYDEIKVWDGFIFEMTLDLAGFTRKISAENIANKIKVSARYKDDTSIMLYTDWVEDLDSQARYGILEHIENTNQNSVITYDSPGVIARDPDTNFLIWEHDLLADKLIKERAYPQPVYAGFNGTDTPSLTVKCVGRQVLANRVRLSDGWLSDDSITTDPTGSDLPIYLRTSGDDTYDELSWGYGADKSGPEYYVWQEIERIVQVIYEQSGWLYISNIDKTNTARTAAGVSSQVSAIDRLRELAEVPGPDGTKYEMFVRQNGAFIYRPRGVTPHFFMYPDGLKHNNGESVGWKAHVGPIQIIDHDASYYGSSSFVYPERVSVANNEARFTPLIRSELDYINAIRDERLWREQAAKSREQYYGTK
jgi:hypothetical protein